MGDWIMSHARSEYVNLKALTPEVHDVVQGLGQLAAKAGLDKQLLELVKLRASQINGCAFCVQYHILQGESLGIPADKLNLGWSGARRRSFQRASAPRWPGQKR
jgi:AhpD family alkylhydroperoxidase